MIMVLAFDYEMAMDHDDFNDGYWYEMYFYQAEKSEANDVEMEISMRGAPPNDAGTEAEGGNRTEISNAESSDKERNPHDQKNRANG
jgi:hypothetical protein